MALKFNPANKYILDLPSRRAIMDPERILAAIGLRSGDFFGDFGCGTGYFSLPAASIVGASGCVFAIDIQPQMLLSVAEKVLHHEVQNVQFILSQETSVALPDDLLDLALMANLLPELEDHQAFYGEVARLIKPSGRVAIMDWHKREMPEGPSQQIRVDREEAIAFCRTSPLEFIAAFTPGPCHYGLLLRRRP